MVPSKENHTLKLIWVLVSVFLPKNNTNWWTNKSALAVKVYSPRKKKFWKNGKKRQACAKQLRSCGGSHPFRTNDKHHATSQVLLPFTPQRVVILLFSPTYRENGRPNDFLKPSTLRNALFWITKLLSREVLIIKVVIFPKTEGGKHL